MLMLLRTYLALDAKFAHEISNDFLQKVLTLTNNDSQYKHGHCRIRHSCHYLHLNKGVEWHEDKNEDTGYSRTIDEQHEYRHDNEEEEVTETCSQATKPVLRPSELTRQPGQTNVESCFKIFNGLGKQMRIGVESIHESFFSTLVQNFCYLLSK